MTKRILIADDDDDLRQALEQLLELEGYHIAGAHNGHAALRLADTQACDLILLDVAMPDADGLDLLVSLHRLRPAVPIIMMSAETGRHTIANALRCGACGFIQKPFDDELVLTTVQRALEPSPGR
jgi:two-component system response regulator AtoC